MTRLFTPPIHPPAGPGFSLSLNAPQAVTCPILYGCAEIMGSLLLTPDVPIAAADGACCVQWVSQSLLQLGGSLFQASPIWKRMPPHIHRQLWPPMPRYNTDQQSSSRRHAGPESRIPEEGRCARLRGSGSLEAGWCVGSGGSGSSEDGQFAGPGVWEPSRGVACGIRGARGPEEGRHAGPGVWELCKGLGGSKGPRG